MSNFSIDNNIIIIGNNSICVTKNYNYTKPQFFLDINNKKIKIDYVKISDNIYKINFLITNKSTVKLFIQDNLIEEYIPLYFLNTEKNIQVNLDDIKIIPSYIKDKVFLKIEKSTKLKKDTTLKFEGDINKTVFWREGSKEIEINFPYHIKGYSVLTFKLNNIIKKIKVFNKDDFPRNLIKIKDGLKLNKTCDWDLRIVSESKEWVIKKGVSIINLENNTDELFKIYVDDFLLFEQHIIFTTYLPKLTILKDPLRIKISQPFHEDISIKFKNNDNRWVIPQGKTEVLLNYNKGIRLLEIEEIYNAIYDKKIWIFTL